MQIGVIRVVFAGLFLFGCGGGDGMFSRGKTPEPPAVIVVQPNTTVIRPKLRPAGNIADTTAGGAAKPMPVPRPEQDLGETIVGLGLLDRGGLWLRTPLVATEVKGRVVYLKTGASANVLLLPLPGESGSGSQLSLAAMQVLGIPLAELAKVQVFVR